ncbi:MFS transporter [Kribbella solani]|uniref:MFS transporter n=1 Tax=Kribbella solani TaxID=236067 RepID=UPI0029ACCE0A|nr:MFS transporter [Kribbella solani]MDX3006128.1 MFS transporter [Kribbella solani]
MTTDFSEPPADVDESSAGSWGELFSRTYLASVSVLAGGVALYAINLYFTAALMPSIVDDIGGAAYYAWVSTGFLMAAVIASMLVSRIVGAWGASTAYLIGFGVFGLGTLANLLSPTMELLVAGRIVQGFGGGLLAGLGYAVISAALPARLWTRATGLISAMWGVGTLVGPTLGGLFAELGAWRGAYGFLLLVAIVLAVLTRRALPHGGGSPDRTPLPVWSLVLLTLTAAAFSVSSTVPHGAPLVAALIAGVLLLVAFLLVEMRGRTSVLPARTYRRGSPLKWVYLTVAALCAGVMTEAFIPLFGQKLAGLSPLLAGLVGAGISVGWVAVQVFSVNFGDRAARRAIRVAPALLTVGLVAYGLLQANNASAVLVVAWAASLFVGGAGIGLAFPHLSVAALSSSDDPGEGAKAAAGLNTTELIANTVASAIAGTLVSLGGTSHVDGARLMALGIAVLTALALIAAFRATAAPRH